jgi:hypothetical protein
MTMITLVLWFVFLVLLIRRIGFSGWEIHVVVAVYALVVSELVFYLFSAARAVGWVRTEYPILSMVSTFRSMARVLICIVALLVHTRRKTPRGSG